MFSKLSVGNQEKPDEGSLSEAEDSLDSIAHNQLVLAFSDFSYSLLFLFFLVYYYFKTNTVVKRNFRENITAGDYALQVKGIPEHVNDPSIVSEHFSQYGEVAEVSLARKYHDLLDDYVKRANLSLQLGY